MNEIITIVEINSTHGDFNTEITLADIRSLKAAAELTDDKLFTFPLAAAANKYKGEEMESKTTKILDLNDVKIYGYTIHEMKPIKKETKKKV